MYDQGEVQMGLIFAVDFDGTLCENAWPDIGKSNGYIIRYLIQARKEGHKLILWTMREGELLSQAIEWCKGQGLEFDAVNDNLPEMQSFYGNNPRKVFANYYIDDHNAFGVGHKPPVLGRKK